MSYAIESKKRKFDRILESLTDGARPSSRASLNSRNNASTSSLAVNEPAAVGSKRRRITPSSLISSLRVTSSPSLTTQYLPASRQAFLERLQSYRQVIKWHVPSTDPINAAAWAKRGWICVDTDLVFCGSCKERFYIELDLDNDRVLKRNEREKQANQEDDYTAATKVWDALIQHNLGMIVTAHSDSCPWRKRGCDSSVQRIEGLLNMTNAISGLETRYKSMTSGIAEPPPVELFSETHEDQMSKFTLDEDSAVNTDVLRLAVCGWRKKDTDVLDCQHCFRSLGLWLYRGDMAAMEKLDAVESHLEYCPWRSPEAQDTELAVKNEDDSGSRNEKIPGWVLVSMAIAKSNVRKKNATTGRTDLASPPGSIASPAIALSPEQRDKKMKDLMRRIKELKKPFNVKALLKRNKARA